MSIAFPKRLHFVCVGPQRTATSWLHLRLRAHPEVALPTSVKETFFFDEHYDRGLDEYWQMFGEVDVDRCNVGEVAPTYFDSEEARRRLEQFAGLKIVISVRDPIERTYSLFRHHRIKGRVPEDYFSAVKQMPRIETSGHYAMHCAAWEAAFGQQNCYYVQQLEIEKTPDAAVNRLCQFLALRELSLTQEDKERYGQATKPPSAMVAKFAARLATTLRKKGFHGPLEFAKKFGVRELVFGKPAGDEVIPSDVREHLERIHADDIRFLHERFTNPK